MTKSRMKTILDNLIEHVSVGNGTKEAVEELLNYGFFPEELIRDFGFAKSEVEAVCGPASDEEEVISVKVYRDTVAPELHGDDGITEIEVKESVLLDWFKEKIRDNFYISGKPDRELLDDWLDQYTPSETTTLYDWIIAKEWNENEIRANEETAAEVLRLQEEDDRRYLLKTGYVRAYQEALKAETNRLRDEDSNNPAYYAQMSWEEGADAREIAGYYIANEGDNAYRAWLKNLSNTQKKEKTPLDSEVTKLLAEVYPDSVQPVVPSSDLRFTSPDKMTSFLQNKDLYNPATETYVSGYNDRGALLVYTGISVPMAEKYSAKMKELGEIGWSAVMPAGGQIYDCDEAFDDPGKSAATQWCEDHYAEKGWIVADEDTFKGMPVKEVPQQWIVSISGSELYDIMTSLVFGTEDEVKNHLITCVQSDRDGERDSWVQGTEKTGDVQKDKNGKLYAQGLYKTYHMDYVAVPVSGLTQIELVPLDRA